MWAKHAPLRSCRAQSPPWSKFRRGGLDNMAAALSTINTQIVAHLEQRGSNIPIAVQRCPHMFGAQFLNKPAGHLVAKLKTKKIYIRQRGHALRIAPHLHVNSHDASRFPDAVDELAN